MHREGFGGSGFLGQALQVTGFLCRLKTRNIGSTQSLSTGIQFRVLRTYLVMKGLEFWISDCPEKAL